jgi:hypothetical protein
MAASPPCVGRTHAPMIPAVICNAQLTLALTTADTAVATALFVRLLAGETAEQKHAQRDKENIGKPNEQLRVRMRISA